MTKKKKLTLIVTCVALVAAIAVGGTLAWFTDSKEVQNTVTFGNVKISLEEPNFNKDGGGTTNTLTGVEPGETFTKDPTITNKGTNDAWIRAKIDVTLPAEGVEEPTYDIKDGWTDGGDGYYYYKDKLTKDNKQVKLFENVTIPGSWTNDVSEGQLKIDVTAEALQADNNGSANNAELWNGVEVKEAKEAE